MRHVYPRNASLRRQGEHVDVEALIEENARLKDLVIQLSKLVVRNVIDPKSAPARPDGPLESDLHDLNTQ
jgi:hypothetical protein